MANKLADARRSLIRAKESAQERLQELENERREIRASLKSLDAALRALGRSNRSQADSRCSDIQGGSGSQATEHGEVLQSAPRR